MSETLTTYNAASKPAVADQYRQATDVAGVCKAIVLKTAQQIQNRKYVRVEGWESIAAAHGCVPSITTVRNETDGIAATAELRRVDNGAVIATAEGFVGNDESTWAKRPLYARRAMAQTRAISRVCRTAFAHVVVLMDAGLETTPAEEVPDGGFDNNRSEPANVTPPAQQHAPTSTPASDLPKAIAGLGDGETATMERVFARVAPPPDGKKAHRVWFVGDGRDYPTMHNFEGIEPGARLSVTIKASAFNGKLYYWVDEYQQVQGDELPMGEPDAQALTPPKGVKEIWPETEFDDATEVIFAKIVNVNEPKVGRSGKPGPYKVEVEIDGQVVTLDTFDEPLAGLATAMGAGGEDVEIAYSTSQNGKYTNRKLLGLR